MSTALDIISNEHRGMWRLTTALESLRGVFENATEKPEAELFTLILDYFETYIERVHQPKEEAFLYRVVRSHTAEVDDMLAGFEQDHANSPIHIAHLRQLLAQAIAKYPAGVGEFVAALDEYVKFMRRHIMKEESVLFPLARKTLTAEDWAEIDAAFANDDDPMFGDKARAELRALLSRIANYAPEPIGLGLDYSSPPPASEIKPVLLEVSGLASYYGRIQALRGIDLEIREGQLVALVGANGAGKTTLLRAISGVQKVSGGRISFAGQEITAMRPDQRVRLGICQVPEGRQVFGSLTVEDNIRLGAYTSCDKSCVAEDLEKMYAMFPILRQKAKLAAGTLSGGQQQMLAMARALMGRPKLLLLDEPSMGLAPLLVEEIFNAIIDLRAQGKTVFLVEQNAHAALSIADQAYVIETGETVLSGPGRELLANERVKEAYLGI